VGSLKENRIPHTYIDENWTENILSNFTIVFELRKVVFGYLPLRKNGIERWRVTPLLKHVSTQFPPELDRQLLAASSCPVKFYLIS
jgi:hypothetical protein